MINKKAISGMMWFLLSVFISLAVLIIIYIFLAKLRTASAGVI